MKTLESELALIRRVLKDHLVSHGYYDGELEPVNHLADDTAFTYRRQNGRWVIEVPDEKIDENNYCENACCQGHNKPACDHDTYPLKVCIKCDKEFLLVHVGNKGD